MQREGERAGERVLSSLVSATGESTWEQSGMGSLECKRLPKDRTLLALLW